MIHLVASAVFALSLMHQPAQSFVPSFAACRVVVTHHLPSTIFHAALDSNWAEFAGREDVLEALKDDRAVILDARTLDEIRQSGYLKTGGHQWIYAPGSPDESPILSLAAEDMIIDKAAPVLVYCASGKRSARAKKTLEEKGYQKVLNLGGFRDLGYLMQQE